MDYSNISEGLKNLRESYLDGDYVVVLEVKENEIEILEIKAL